MKTTSASHFGRYEMRLSSGVLQPYRFWREAATDGQCLRDGCVLSVWANMSTDATIIDDTKKRVVIAIKACDV